MQPSLLSYLPSFIKNRIEGRQNLQKILRNTGWLFFDKFLRMGVGLIVGVWVARYLGLEQFGAINFAIAFVALFGAFATLGLDGIVVRDIVREPFRKFEILSSAFILKIGGGCVALLISIVAIFLLRPNDNQTHWLVGIIAAGMIFQSFDAIDLWFQSQVQSKYTVIAKNFAFLLIAVVRVVLILNKAPLIAFAWAILAETIAGAIGLVVFYQNRNSLKALWSPAKKIAYNLVNESWPLMLSGIAIMIYMRIDQIMLGQMDGNKEVGLYSAALRFSEIWYFIPMAIVSSVMPTLTQLRSESKEKYYQRLQQLLNYLVRIAYVIALPMTFISTFLVTFLYGHEFSKAGVILAIHIWSSIFVFMGVGISPWIINEGMMKYSLIQTVGGAIINIVLNIFLIPRYGGIGAAIATVIAYSFAAFLLNAIFPKTKVIFKIQYRALLQLK